MRWCRDRLLRAVVVVMVALPLAVWAQTAPDGGEAGGSGAAARPAHQFRRSSRYRRVRYSGVIGEAAGG